jgi:GAF domain-containing protein
MRVPVLRRPDPEAHALRALADALRALPQRHRVDDELQVVVELAASETRSRYAALTITDVHDRTQGFFTAGLSEEQLRGLRTPPQGHGPLGALRADGRPLRLDDVEAHRKSFGFPPRHPRMRSLLGVPLWAHGEMRGSLYVTNRRDGRPFDDADERAMVLLGEHASRVIAERWDHGN